MMEKLKMFGDKGNENKSFIQILRFIYMHFHIVQKMKQIYFNFSDIPRLLCISARKGELHKLKRIFEYIKENDMEEEVIREYGDTYKKLSDQKIVDIKAEFYSYTPLEFERTPLMEAAKNGHFNVCEYLIEHQNANVDIKSNDQWTAIMYAAFNNHLNIVQLLIKHNADIRSQDKSGDTVAYLVARHGNLDIMKVLLDKDLP